MAENDPGPEPSYDPPFEPAYDSGAGPTRGLRRRDADGPASGSDDRGGARFEIGRAHV